MEPFVRHTGTAAPLRLANVDTDQLIPARFGVGVSRTGYGRALLYDKRAEPGFVLNRPAHRDATILVAEENFGCGSSREMAVWALWGYGFRAVLAPSFGDIFRGNSLKNGLLTVTLPADRIAWLLDLVDDRPATPVTVDLERCEVHAADAVLPFTLDPEQRRRLLHGLDDITLTLQHVGAIEAYEHARRATLPTIRRTAGSAR
jgi:3-isopropylmalate/(R)-2-methylmalate dehydratase small subunit